MKIGILSLAFQERIEGAPIPISSVGPVGALPLPAP